jgi:hypothetical protein
MWLPPHGKGLTVKARRPIEVSKQAFIAARDGME